MPIRILSALMLLLVAVVGRADDHGVVLVYHHVSEDTPASTSVTPERFEQHLDYLAGEGFDVWPLERLLSALIDGAEAVPDNVVALTFDDAYESVYSEAWPRLADRGWPFTVFVNTDAVDAGHAPYLDWERLAEMADSGVSIGNHSAGHGHLIARREGESGSDWRQRVAADIRKAGERIEGEIGRAPTLFAYPYGERSQALAEIVGEGHDFALAQRSGAVGPGTDRLSVPRFPMASGFDGMDRFALAVDARPLPVVEAEPDPPGDGIREAVDSLRLSVAEGGYRVGELACYASTGERLDTAIEEGPPHRVDIEVGGRGSTGRNKINCTAPASDGSGEYFWFAFQWVQDAARD